jgi:2-phosphosulfolactate phosphatase
MLTALHHGAAAIIPVIEIEEALAVKQRQADALLAGERNGLRIGRELTGSVEFDFGNSPRDFTVAKVKDQTIAWTTTNGTRALRACAHGEMILLGALVNLNALSELLDTLRPRNLLLICAGTFETAAFEDIFAAGALLDRLRHLAGDSMSDAACAAWHAFRHVFEDNALVTSSLNARRLLANPDLAPDVPLCLARDSAPLNASMLSDGSVRALPGFGAKLA